MGLICLFRYKACFKMKQFFLYVLATIAGLWLTIILSVIGTFLMLIVMIAGSAGGNSPVINDKSVLYVNLEGVIEERIVTKSLVEELQGLDRNVIALNDLIKAIDNASTDSRIEGIYVDCKGASSGSATSLSIRNALLRFKESGKWIVAYADAYTQSDYYMATVADSLWLNPEGAVDVHGLGGTLIFYKGMLDKLGVDAQIIKVGTFKSAVEPFILTEASEANKKQIREYITPMWNYISEGIASSRGVSATDVNEWADKIISTSDPEDCVVEKVVTGLCYRHEVEDWIKSQVGIESDDDLSLVSPSDYVASLSSDTSSNKIAVLYAVGDIVDTGDSGIVGAEMAPLILELAEDDDVDALVLRVNSGGGSAFASEQIWEALQQFKAKGKPFYVSMGDVAASGGYYISCAADRIYCEPTSITGSIGIFGIIPCVKELMNDKLGITTTTIATNPNGQMSVMNPLTDMQRMALQKAIDRGYETFVKRCAEGRGVSIDSIKAIAEGRVWDGQTAVKIGLVDENGSLQDAIDRIALESGYDKYEIVEYPNPDAEWWSMMMKMPSTVKQRLLEEELGEAYEVYKTAKNLKNLETIQCRMQPVVIE